MINLKRSLSEYTLKEVIYLSYCFFITKTIFFKARLIRFPFRMRGKRWISIGKGFTTGVNCRIDAFPINKKAGCCIKIDDNCEINDYAHIASVSSVSIGKNVLIASKVYISDHDHGTYKGYHDHDTPLTPPNERSLSYKPVIIEDNVWIGQNVSVLKGVTIGRGSVIGSNSVVNRDIDANSIAVGIPAKVVKKFDFATSKWENI